MIKRILIGQFLSLAILAIILIVYGLTSNFNPNLRDSFRMLVYGLQNGQRQDFENLLAKELFEFTKNDNSCLKKYFPKAASVSIKKIRYLKWNHQCAYVFYHYPTQGISAEFPVGEVINSLQMCKFNGKWKLYSINSCTEKIYEKKN